MFWRRSDSSSEDTSGIIGISVFAVLWPNCEVCSLTILHEGWFGRHVGRHVLDLMG